MELLLAWVANWKIVASGALIAMATISSMAVLFGPLADGMIDGFELMPALRRVWKPWIGFAAFLAFILTLPNVDDLWRVRIGLIKLQLASPENLQKGADEIGRIAHKLECKYLGCDDAKQR